MCKFELLSIFCFRHEEFTLAISARKKVTLKANFSRPAMSSEVVSLCYMFKLQVNVVSPRVCYLFTHLMFVICCYIHKTTSQSSFNKGLCYLFTHFMFVICCYIHVNLSCLCCLNLIFMEPHKFSFEHQP